jgi:hypothetical protein
MIERRKAPRKDWVIGRDETGRSVLKWKVDFHQTKRQETDPSARTYNFLQKLNVPDLALEDERARRRTGRNPYDSTRAFAKIAATKSRKRNPARKEPGSS